MITQTENEKLTQLVNDARNIPPIEYDRDFRYVESIWNKIYEYINSLTEKPKTYYAVNFNPVGYLPESEPYEGLENIDEIIDAIDDICYQFEYRFDLDAWNELPEKRHIREMLTELIDKNQLEHETIGYIGDYCIFVYKDDEYEYRQSK
jgi:uncharacterized radical SAM superfamily Fe-S cluster-containing enzyme